MVQDAPGIDAFVMAKNKNSVRAFFVDKTRPRWGLLLLVEVGLLLVPATRAVSLM